MGPKPRQRPKIIIQPQNVTVSLHQTVVLECMATGNPWPIISWSRADSKPIDVYNAKVLGNGNLVITDANSKHSGVYLCRATTPGTRNYTVAAANVTVLGTVNSVILHLAGVESKWSSEFSFTCFSATIHCREA